MVEEKGKKKELNIDDLKMLSSATYTGIQCAELAAYAVEKAVKQILAVTQRTTDSVLVDIKAELQSIKQAGETPNEKSNEKSNEEANEKTNEEAKEVKPSKASFKDSAS